MPILVDALLEISSVGEVFSNEVRNVWQYQVITTAPTITAAHVGEAWWNNVKTVLRGIIPTSVPGYYRSVEVRELNNIEGAIGIYGIPAGEQAGTRSATGGGDIMPPYVAVAARLNVGTRATRPGQKRFGGVLEGDNVNGQVQTALKNAVDTAMAHMIQTLTLGSPAAAMTLLPIVCRKDSQGFVTAFQNIESWNVNQYLSTQNTRKFQRGA